MLVDLDSSLKCSRKGAFGRKAHYFSDRQGNNYLLLIAAAFHYIFLQFSFYNVQDNGHTFITQQKFQAATHDQASFVFANAAIRNTAILPKQSTALSCLHNFCNSNCPGEASATSASQSLYHAEIPEMPTAALKHF